MKEIFAGVFREDRTLLTKNLVPSLVSCEETLLKKGDVEYRTWDPTRSKLAAAIVKGLKRFPLEKNFKVLYLGVASGTTASYISDILGKKGLIYGIEFSDRVLSDLFIVAERRKNIVPILADARRPDTYTWIEPVDLIYEDVAQPDMLAILVRNADLFLKKDGLIMFAVKSRSIDVTKKPEEIYKKTLDEMKSRFEIIDWLRLDPFERDHLFIVARKH